MSYCTAVVYQKDTLEPLFALVALDWNELADEIHHLIVVSEHEVGLYGWDASHVGAAAIYKLWNAEVKS